MPRISVIAARLRAAAGTIAFLPPLAARIVVGWIMVESGWGKLHRLPDVIEFFRGLHIPAPEVQAPFAAGTELACGALLIAGLATRLAALPLMVVMTVAIVTAKRDEIASASDLFALSEFLIIVVLAMLVAHGAGALSLDRALRALFGRVTSASSADARTPPAAPSPDRA